MREIVQPGPPVAERIQWVEARGRAFDATVPSERTSARVLNTAYEQDLAALPPDIWSSEKLIVAPAVSQNQIVGLVRTLRAKADGERLRVICQLMFAPNWTPWGRAGKLGKKLYREAFSLAGPMIGSASDAVRANSIRSIQSNDTRPKSWLTFRTPSSRSSRGSAT